MNPTKMHDLDQSLWLDNITRDLLNSGTLQRYTWLGRQDSNLEWQNQNPSVCSMISRRHLHPISVVGRVRVTMMRLASMCQSDAAIAHDAGSALAGNLPATTSTRWRRARSDGPWLCRPNVRISIAVLAI
jgi:hypothetical protein